MKRPVQALIIVLALILSAYFLGKRKTADTNDDVASVELDKIVVALQENSDRLEVSRIKGEVTTVANVSGGPFGTLHGKMTVKQPWSVGYFVNMGDLGLDDYIWDASTRTLIVRAPAITADAPNIDETRQSVDTRGVIVTRNMQDRLRQAVAVGARNQATEEAAKPVHMASAASAARAAIKHNLLVPLGAAKVGQVRISVHLADKLDGGNLEPWDVSRSLQEVLRQRT